MDSQEDSKTQDLNPSVADIARWTDTYFLRTKATVGRFGDKRVTYAIFMRRPVVSAPRLAVEWLEGVARERGFEVEIDLIHREGRWVGAGEPIMYISRPALPSGRSGNAAADEAGSALRRGLQCLHHVRGPAQGRLPRHGRPALRRYRDGGDHGLCGQRRLGQGTRKVGAIGFIGNATDATAHYFGRTAGMGTMPHALIGYAGSTARAAEMFHETFPDQDLTVLVDYFGREVTDSLEVCRRLPELAASGRLSMRIDTPGGRFIEGLDPPGSYAVLEKHVPSAIRGYRDETQLRYLIGTGVSAAAIFHLRDALDAAGFDKVRIVASSGFSPAKCRIMAEAQAPIDVIGTGSYLPERWTETYATADIIEYDGEKRVKVGREFLFRK